MFLTAWKTLKVLAVGAHPDDIELGAGGFIYRLMQEIHAQVYFLILTHGLKSWQGPDDFDKDQRRRESMEAADVLGVEKDNVTILGYEDCGLHRDLHQLIQVVEKATAAQKFDIVLAHAKGDRHNDHATAHEATIAGTRTFDGTILLYQAPSTVPNDFRPAFFVDLKPDQLDAKQTALKKHVSQREKWFMSEHRIPMLAQGWASFFNASATLLEAFEVYKSFWDQTADGQRRPPGRS
jgi:LmbE family N-acetylglucosaminyl deacetylase